MKKIFNIAKHLLLLPEYFLLSLPVSAQSYPQIQGDDTTVKIAANPEYNKAGRIQRILLGEHYRKEWATPVDVPVLNPDTFAGGLVAIKMGGGMQTKSLRMQGADGREYVLRSVNKDPSKAIVAELRGTFADDVVQDQISSSNPYAPVVVAALAEAAGIFHSTPQLVFVRNSASLGEYEKFFAESLCLLEERPSGNQRNTAAYGFSENIINSEKLFEKVFGNSHHQVDEKAFLKARLFDILIGDWDRHEDQWVWASFREDGTTFYKPVPRDRDQAFSNLDGLIPQMASRKWMIRKTKNFDYRVQDVNGLCMGGNHLDRNFTTRLTLNDWMNTVTDLKNELTDERIDAAFEKMPAAIYNISGATTKAKLKSRRDHLDLYARQYYRFLTREVIITGTNDKEIFEVIRISNDSTLVKLYRADANPGSDKPYYQRIFLRTETKEIRLYGLEGNDIFTVRGKAGKGILVRIAGGKGNDSYYDRSLIKGMNHLTKIYDNDGNSFNTGSESKQYISSDSLKNEYRRKSYRYDWLAPVQKPGYNPDDGIYLGGGLVWKKQQYGKSPYGFMQSIGANYAFKTGAYTFWYRGLFKEFAGKWDLNLETDINAPNNSRNYFGMGNETVKTETTKNYYRVRYNQVLAAASLRRQIGRHQRVETGIGFQSVKVENTRDRFISANESKLDSSDFGRKNYGDIHLSYQFSTVNNTLYPTSGITINAGIKYTQDLNAEEKNFVQVFSEFSAYHSFGRFTLATRTGLSANLSDQYAFFQANTLGLSANLRGYRKDRFAGKTAIYQNTELRYRVGALNAYVVKGSWGLMTFLDHGRVWIPGEDSKKWHSGYGGGVWFLPFNKMALTVTYGLSNEEKLVSISAGFLF